MAHKQQYEYSVLHHHKEGDEKVTDVLVPVTQVLAASADAARSVAIRAIPDEFAGLIESDELEIKVQAVFR